jgi:hypothetical protein
MLPTFTLNCEEISAWVGSGTIHWKIVQSELLNLQKDGQFPDDPVRIKDSHIHYVNTKTSRRTNNRRYKDDGVRGTIITVCVVLAYFVRSSLIKWSCKSFGYHNNYVPTSLTSDPNHLLCFHCVCCVKEVSDWINHPVVITLDTRVDGTSAEVVTRCDYLKLLATTSRESYFRKDRDLDSNRHIKKGLGTQEERWTMRMSP